MNALRSASKKGLKPRRRHLPQRFCVTGHKLFVADAELIRRPMRLRAHGAALIQQLNAKAA